MEKQYGTLDIQRRLISLGYNLGPADGVPGPKTTTVVKSFQTHYGLVSDGIVGSQKRGQSLGFGSLKMN